MPYLDQLVEQLKKQFSEHLDVIFFDSEFISNSARAQYEASIMHTSHAQTWRRKPPRGFIKFNTDAYWNCNHTFIVVIARDLGKKIEE